MDEKPSIHKSTVRLQVAAVLDEPPKDSLLNNASWRYTPALRLSWLNNYVDAGAVSTAEATSAWKRLKAGASPPAASAPAPAPAPTDPKAKGKAAAPAPAPAPVAAPPADSTQDSGPALLAFSHTVDLSGDLLTATKINEAPVANMLVGLHPTLLKKAGGEQGDATAAAGGAAAAPSAGKGGKSAAPAKPAPSAGATKGGAPAAAAGDAASTSGSAPPALHFVGMVPLDCSPLLAGYSTVSVCFGDVSAAIEAAKIEVGAGKKSNSDSTSAPVSGGEGAPPAGSAVSC
jgi:hypothetical protein